MPNVQHILDRKQRGKQVIGIGENATVLDAAKRMNEHRIGALVVTSGERVVGIFTERDILNRVVAAQRDASTTRVGDVMTSPVAVCSPDTARATCRTVMKSRRIRHIPVVVDDRLVGIVSIGDVVEDSEADNEETIRYLYEYMFGDWSLAAAH